MSRTTRILLLVAGAVAVAVIAFVALSPGDDDSSSTAATTTAVTTATAPAATTTTTTTTPKPEATVVQIKGGEPVGGVKTISVKQGDQVRIVVTSDAAGEVHLHGYDIEREVSPSAPARFNFTAKNQGRYEMELHGADTKLAQVDVTP